MRKLKELKKDWDDTMGKLLRVRTPLDKDSAYMMNWAVGALGQTAWNMQGRIDKEFKHQSEIYDIAMSLNNMKLDMDRRFFIRGDVSLNAAEAFHKKYFREITIYGKLMTSILKVYNLTLKTDTGPFDGESLRALKSMKGDWTDLSNNVPNRIKRSRKPFADTVKIFTEFQNITGRLQDYVVGVESILGTPTLRIYKYINKLNKSQGSFMKILHTYRREDDVDGMVEDLKEMLHDWNTEFRVIADSVEDYQAETNIKWMRQQKSRSASADGSPIDKKEMKTFHQIKKDFVYRAHESAKLIYNDNAAGSVKALGNCIKIIEGFEKKLKTVDAKGGWLNAKLPKRLAKLKNEMEGFLTKFKKDLKKDIMLQDTHNLEEDLLDAFPAWKMEFKKIHFDAQDARFNALSAWVDENGKKSKTSATISRSPKDYTLKGWLDIKKRFYKVAKPYYTMSFGPNQKMIPVSKLDSDIGKMTDIQWEAHVFMLGVQRAFKPTKEIIKVLRQSDLVERSLNGYISYVRDTDAVDMGHKDQKLVRRNRRLEASIATTENKMDFIFKVVEQLFKNGDMEPLG